VEQKLKNTYLNVYNKIGLTVFINTNERGHNDGVSLGKVVLRYGHVGHRNEVARYIVTPKHVTITKVMDFVQTMPGVKKQRSFKCRSN